MHSYGSRARFCHLYPEFYESARIGFDVRERGQISPYRHGGGAKDRLVAAEVAWLAQVAAKIPENDQEAGIAGLRVLRDLY